MSSPCTEPQLLDALARGVRVVLPNSRAARALRRAFDDRQRATGAAVWESAAVLSWADWIRSLRSNLVADGAELRLLLNPAQEHILWRDIIASAAAEESLSSPDSLAALVRSAFQLAAAHQAIPRLRSTATTSDSRTFAAWAESFVRLCATQTCLSASLLEDALRAHTLAGSLHLDSPILLAGFAEFTPAQTALLDALLSTGASLATVSLTAQEESVISTAAQRSGETCISTPPMRATNHTALRATTIAPTPREELHLAAHWIRHFLEDHTTPNYTPRLAVLLPKPEGERAGLEQVFREVLAPELELISADLSSAPWEFAAGAALATQPMVTDALDLLRWTQGPLPLERVSALLRSPFLGSSSDRLAAARFDAKALRRGPLLIPEFDLESVRKLDAHDAHRKNSLNASVPWLQAVGDLSSTRRNPTLRSFADWAEHFRAILQSANWAAAPHPDRETTASEFATSRAWDSTLDLLATLDFRGRRVPLSDALESLERLVQTARVPAPAANAPIQIMSPIEAEGATFDAVVLLRATDDAWPEPQHLHPLLGWPLQQSLNLPGANAAHDAEQARARAESLLSRTTNILITSAAANADGPLRPSPLLQHLHLNHIDPSKLIQIPTPATPLEEELIPDDAPLPPLPAPDLRGGANVLKLQAACGFLAFAELRLNARSPEPTELGLDPGERGNLVHNALEAFWTDTHSQNELASLTPEERTTRLHRAIDAAFAKLPAATETWTTTYLALQRDRLHHLLSLWLDEELKRGPFTVLSREDEAETHIDIGSLRLKVRPDRIDRVEDAETGFALIDYKTGYGPKPANWLGDRPDDPQLPLYALLHEPGELKALLFGHIRPGEEMKWSGLENEVGILPRSRAKTLTNMDARVDEWRDVLTTLADDFASGRAGVSPKNYPATCKHCGQRLLCRLDPASLLNTDEDSDNENQEDADG